MTPTRRDFVRNGIAATTATATLPLLAGCTLPGGSDGEQTTTTLPDGTAVVEVGPDGQYTFVPGTDEPLTIETGTTVRFVWKSNTHNVHVTSQPDGANWQGHDQIENEGFSFESTFTVPGTYEYVCEPHESLGMVGTIVVEE